MSLLESYLRHGLALVSVPAGSKAPISSGWNERANAIIDVVKASTITGNVGLLHLYSDPPTASIDIDDLDKAKSWFSERGINLEKYLHSDDAVGISSGRDNRSKLLFRLPNDISILNTLQIVDPITKEMVLEFRCASKNGRSVQDILPPSFHPNGNQYSWVGKGTWTNLPELPDKILKSWTELVSSSDKVTLNQTTKFLMHSTTPETPREIARLESMLEFISADCSYDVYRNVVWALLSTDWDCAEQLAYEWSMTVPDRFEETTFNELIKTYDDSKTPTLGTIYHLARSGGWNG